MGTWTTTVPTATNEGTYNIYWKLIGDSNHNDVAQTLITASIQSSDITNNFPCKYDSFDYAVIDTYEYSYTGDVQTVTLGAGNYILQCWGAQGGNCYGDGILETGAKGGYSEGILTLASSITIYIYVGGAGGSHDGTAGYNGGGSGRIGTSITTYSGGGGGGASDIRIGQDSLYARVITAGGGGGCANGGSTQGRYAGVGGGLTGGDTTITYTYNSNFRQATGATQTSGGIYGYYGSGQHYASSSQNGTFGQGGGITGVTSGAVGGGGGGWYGGAASCWGPGSGGSGYVYTSSTASSYPSGCTLNSNYYLIAAQTIAGSDYFISPTNTAETGHEGNGYVKITKVSISWNE